jgi:threonine/homoserine/homoserine lactone efflux protein
MNYQILLPFLIGMIILAASPGPGVFASMARAVSEGFQSSLFFIGGLVCGDIIFLLLALLGLSVIAKVLGTLFILIRIVGGLYLIYLGIKMFRSKRFQFNLNNKGKFSRSQSYIGGFLTTMGNPKPVLFYASVLPTIINFNDVRITDAVIMIILIALVSFLVLGTYSYIASLSHKIKMSDNLQKGINQIAGIVMMLIGFYVIIK